MTQQTDWFGKTGLGEEIEQQLCAHLQYEYSMYDFSDEEELQASDMEYLGLFKISDEDRMNEDAEGYFSDDTHSVHLWRILDNEVLDDEIDYAYITIGDNGVCEMFAGDYLPENTK